MIKMANEDTASSLKDVGKKKKREFNNSWRKERKTLKEETNQLKDDIKGNPKVVEAIRKLERRVELLEEKID